jgi:broad specificity phosphatase PhoE
MKELWWIRHGETDWNLEVRIQGSSDVELNETGVAQARALAPKLQEVAFDAVYASDLARARRTAEIALPGAVVRSDPRLRELSHGILEGARWADLTPEQTAAARHWREDPRRRRLPGGGESYDELTERVAAFTADLPAEGRFAAVAHGGTIRSALYAILGPPGGSTWRVAIDNCSVTRLRFGDRGVTILAVNEGVNGWA